MLQRNVDDFTHKTIEIEMSIFHGKERYLLPMGNGGDLYSCMLVNREQFFMPEIVYSDCLS